MRTKVYRGAIAEPRPFLKWVGGKRRLLRVLDPYVPPQLDEYHELFLGGGALLWHVLRTRGPVPHVTVGDSNARLVRTYCAVRDDVDEVVRLLRDYERDHRLYGRDLYEGAKSMDVDQTSSVEVAAWMIYLNRTCYNGLYRVNSRGRFNVPFGDYAEPKVLDESNLRACSAALRGVSVLCENACDALARIESAGPRTMVYLDPTYAGTGESSGFDAYTSGGCGPETQRRVAAAALRVKELGARVVVTNSDAPLVRELYPEPTWRVERVEVRGNAVSRDGAKRGRVGELVIS